MNGTSLTSDFKHWVKQGNSVTILIVINIVIFLIFALSDFVSAAGSSAIGAFLYDNLSLHTLPSILIRKPWGMITTAFTHTYIWHILGNMLIFFFFGNLFRSELGNKRVVPLYLLSGLLCSFVLVLFYNLLPGLRGTDTTGIGASGAVMCFLVAAATLMPNLEIAIFFIINVRIKWVAAAIVLIDLVSLPHNNNFGGHIAHLAGAAFGYLYVRQLQQGRDLVAPISRFFDWAGGLFTQKEPAARKFKPKKSPLRVVRNNEPSHASRLDQLLDKINEKGYNSLTSEEKSWLRKYSDEK